MDEKVFDCHSDIPSRIAEYYDDNTTEDMVKEETVLENEFLSDMRDDNIMGRVAAVYLSDKYVPEMSTHRALNQIQYLKAESSVVDDVEVVDTVSDMRDNCKNNVM